MRVYVILLSMTTDNKTIRFLQRLGLTAYEAKADAVLIQAGTLTLRGEGAIDHAPVEKKTYLPSLPKNNGPNF